MQAWVRRGFHAAAIGLALSTTAPTLSAQGLAGPYLAANQADLRNDYLAASDYYVKAIKLAPDNGALLNGALVTSIGAGQIGRATILADTLAEAGSTNQIMALTQLAVALERQDYARAEAIVQNGEYRLNPLFSSLVEGWARVGQGDFAGATTVFEGMKGNSAMEAYGSLHKALALALAGDFGAAATVLDGGEDGPLHLNRMAMLTHIISLSQADRIDEALAIVNDTRLSSRSDPTLNAMAEVLSQGTPLPFDQLSTAADGAAAVYAILASALTREDAGRLGLIYGRLASHIRENYDEMTTLIGEILSDQRQYELAAKAFKGVSPDSAWYVSAEVGRADALTGADRTDEAIEVLSNLARAKPGNQTVLIALGDTLRSEEEFAGATDAYSRAIEQIDEPGPSDWRLFYVRGISYERTDKWPMAEADFRKALELNPEQPHVLNYLGYSLVELRRNLEEAQGMIERAVAQRPQDGYITDSLGWVLYRLGKFEEAVAPMERAVELEPLDPIINDHLGDVLWMVGRKTEAVFQWKRALSFGPEPEDAERIRRKLDVGLDVVLAEEAEGGEQTETALGE